MLREEHAARDCRRPGGRRGRCAACPRRPTAAPRSGRPDRPRPCRCPSSSEEVATIAGQLARSSAALRSRARCSRATEPWCASASSSPAGLVERRGQPLGEAAAVDEDHRRAVRADQLDQARVDRRARSIARRGAARAPGPSGISASSSPSSGHVLDGHFDRQLERACARRVDDRRPGAASQLPPRRRLDAAEQARDLVERPLRRREADALQRRARRSRSASSRSSERKRCAPRLVGDERVDLVDDHRLDRARGSRARCEVSSR